MARRLNIMTFLHEARGLAAVTQRSLQPQHRERLIAPARPLPASRVLRLSVSTDVQSHRDSPRPVRVIHVLSRRDGVPAHP